MLCYVMLNNAMLNNVMLKHEMTNIVTFCSGMLYYVVFVMYACKCVDIDVCQNTVSKTTKINHGGFSVFGGDCWVAAVVRVDNKKATRVAY